LKRTEPVSPDGQKFYLNLTEQETPPTLTVLVNWMARGRSDLRRPAPALGMIPADDLVRFT
jgi:hypothetical protein